MFPQLFRRENPVLGTPPNLILCISPLFLFLCWGDPKSRTWRQRNPPSNPQNRSILGVVLQGGDSSSGFLVWKPLNRFVPPGGVSSYTGNQIPAVSFQWKLYSWFDDYRKKDEFSIKTLLSQKNLKWSKTGLWQRLYTKKPRKIAKKSPSAPSRKKERKNERTLPSIFFKSQHADTFQGLTAPHSLVTGARSGEAQRADAAARHQGRSKPWSKIKSGPIPGIYRIFLNTGGSSVFFQYLGSVELPLKIQGLIFDEPPVFLYFGR